MEILKGATSLKLKKCKACGEKFEPSKPLQQACGWQCAIVIAGKKRIKDEAKRKNIVKKQIKEQLKTRSDWMKEAQQSFNSWIRYRDKDEPCISCQRHHQGQYHAGHYRTTKAAPELRFNELNVHKQCSVCNNHMSGNITEYRINLVKKIGVEQVEWLEGKHEAKHYSIEDLKEIKETYKLKLKEAMKNENQF
jgi:hypothetical protein